MKTAKKLQSGFTVIEMLVATAVASALLVLILTFMTNTLVNNSIETAKSDLLREAQLTLDSMSRNIRLSANVDEINRWQDDYSPNAAATSGYGWTSDANTLILATSATDSDKNILFQDATHYITYKNNIIYFVQNNTLYSRQLAGNVPGNSASNSCPAPYAGTTCVADRLLANDVSSFSVRYLDSLDTEVAPSAARSVELTIKLETEKYGRKIDATYVTRTVFRNE